MNLRQRCRAMRPRMLLFLTIVGLGIITANVDNDAGGITSYSVAGVRYRYSLLRMPVLFTVALSVVQEMSSIVDKGIKLKDYNYEQLDVVVILLPIKSLLQRMLDNRLLNGVLLPVNLVVMWG